MNKKIFTIGTLVTAVTAAAFAAVHCIAYHKGFNDAREEYLEDIEDMSNGIDDCGVQMAMLEEELDAVRESNHELRIKVAALSAENETYHKICTSAAAAAGMEITFPDSAENNEAE